MTEQRPPSGSIEDQQAMNLRDLVSNLSSDRPDNIFGTRVLFDTCGFTPKAWLGNGFPLFQSFLRETSNLERVEVLKGSFAGTILEDVGLARPPSLSNNQTLVGWNGATISKNRIQDADGDVLFLWAFDDTPQAQQSTQEKLARLKASPHFPNWHLLSRTKRTMFPATRLGKQTPPMGCWMTCSKT